MERERGHTTMSTFIPTAEKEAKNVLSYMQYTVEGRIVVRAARIFYICGAAGQVGCESGSRLLAPVCGKYCTSSSTDLCTE